MSTQQQIKETIKAIANLESVKSHFQVLEDSINKMKDELSNKTSDLSKEQDDIDKLENITISSVFHKVMGNKEEKLEKERQEYLALALKVRELKKTIELSEFEKGVLEKKVLQMDAHKANLEQLKTTRLNEIIQYNAPEKAMLVALLEEEDSLSKYNAQIEEAFNAGSQAYENCGRTLQLLQAAIEYGEMDMWGSDIHSYSKHDALNKAEDAAYHTQVALNIYAKELQDVGISDQHLHLNITTLANFTDVFFDNLITDWIIQNKIKNSFNIVQGLHDKIHLIQQSLKVPVKKNDARLAEITSQREQILTS